MTEANISLPDVEGWWNCALPRERRQMLEGCAAAKHWSDLSDGQRAELRRKHLELSSNFRFPLGKTVVTQGVLSLFASGGLNLVPYVMRHARGDWGDLCAEDAHANDLALSRDGRVMSSYKIDDSLTLWIITEWDRSVTTLLLPSEY